MNKRRLILGILFLLIGLILISIPLYHEWKQGQGVTALEEALSLIEASDGEPVDLSQIDNLPFTEEEIKNVLELEIPYINIQQKVLNRTTEENLAIALTQIKEDQVPGKGNFTIAGHRGYRDGRHFSNLAEVPMGEKVYLHSSDQTFVYEIISSEVIEPTNIGVLDDKKDLNEITMITCTISGKERVAVKGVLIDTIVE
ncbi:class D sortase [Sporosarcina sp. 6E9]|uniref:class D sortase n=1 Tax=Sporosarcina sp. 6E9 TaxID=2819235 RepID=UPI001B313AC5|nr:class D sortase [Sporosarcina sp. 6E9]